MAKVNEAQYLEMVKETLAKEGLQVADRFNKLALENKAIDTALYSKAARILVDAYLAQ